MLVVRAEQRTAMWPSLLRQRVTAHVREGYPEDYAILGAETVKAAVDLGIARAAQHGFEQGDDVEKYVDLMFLLGAYFDEDPLYPWAVHILNDPGLASPSIRIHNLEVTAAGHLLRTAGAEGEHYKAALVRARRMPFEDLVRRRAEDPSADLQALLYGLYPQQYTSLTKATLAALVARASNAGDVHGMASREGRLILAALMFLLGSHFDRDPLQPWAPPVFQGRSDPATKTKELHQAAMDRLDLYRLVNRGDGSTAR